MEDTHKTVWVIHIPKHLPKLPVYAQNKAWQRIEDSLVELTPERLNAIWEEQLLGNILKELKEEGAVSLKGLSWYEVQNPTKKKLKLLRNDQ